MTIFITTNPNSAIGDSWDFLWNHLSGPLMSETVNFIYKLDLEVREDS